MIMLKLPFPPSVNTYWRNYKGRIVLSDKGRSYKNTVKEFFDIDIKHTPFGKNDELKVFLDLYPGDKRRRDVDNYSKSVLDALESTSLYGNDNQVKLHLQRMNNPINDIGYCIVGVGLLSESFGIIF